MKVPRICTNCLRVVPPKPVQYGEDEEENRKLDSIDSQMKCPKCKAKLTPFIHHVWDRVKDNEEITKTFGVVNNETRKKTEELYVKFVAAREFTEGQLQRDIEKYNTHKQVKPIA